MEKNYSSTDPSEIVDSELSLPHFDEDRTLLSAKPVVPLHEVQAGTRSKRRIIFGLTILAAILLGAISATLLLMQSAQNSENAAEADVSSPTLPSTGAAGGASSESAEARPPVVAKSDEVPRPSEAPIVRDLSIKKQSPAAISRNSEKPARLNRPDRERADEDFDSDDLELRRAERRDARREARRQRRNRREQVGDELLRIREIFEGSPRP